MAAKKPEPNPPAPATPPAEAEPEEATADLAEWSEPSELEIETEVLVRMLKHEIGVRWMSIDLRLQIERVELLLDLTGTVIY